MSEFTRGLFLSAVMERDEGWVLKGGTGMMCRFGRVRATKDLDMFRRGEVVDSPVASAQDLVHLMDGVQVGAYRFSCSVARGPVDDERNACRVLVEVGSAGRVLTRFSIDVSAKVYLSKDAETVVAERTDQATIPGYPRRFVVRLYPLENQMADKLCAIYEVHNGAHSTRYRDLYDLALMADRGSADDDDLVDAVEEQQFRRRLRVARPLAPPSATWPAEYDRAMRRMPGIEAQYAHWTDAMAIVEARLEHVLDRVAGAGEGGAGPRR